MGEIKQVIAVRTDLGMGKGKIAAQVGHACVMGSEHVRKSHPEWWSEWWGGQEKVVVKVSGIKELQEVISKEYLINILPFFSFLKGLLITVFTI